MTKEIYPPPKTFISFDDKKAAKYASPLSIIGFADFEAKLDDLCKDSNEIQKKIMPSKSFTIKKDLHTIVSFSLIFVDIDGELIFEKCYCGNNAGKYFFDTLDKIASFNYM